jgi:hypothetical protein
MSFGRIIDYDMNYSNTNRITTFYPNVKFHDREYLGDSPSNSCYQICDYCKEYKQMHTLNEPIYYKGGAKRRLVSYCNDCKNTAFAAGCVIVVDYKYFGYYEILDAIRDNGEEGNKPINFEEAVRRAFNRTENVSYNGIGAESGVSMLKRYLGGRRRNQDNNIPFDSERLWEFRYKLQYEEPRVKVIQQDPLVASWNTMKMLSKIMDSRW